MILPVGVKIRSGNRTFKNECPDSLVTEAVKKQIKEFEERKSKGNSLNKKLEKERLEKEFSLKEKKKEDKAIIEKAKRTSENNIIKNNVVSEKSTNT